MEKSILYLTEEECLKMIKERTKCKDCKKTFNVKTKTIFEIQKYLCINGL